MRYFSVRVGAVLAVAATLYCAGAGRADDVAVGKGTALLAEGDRLADQGQFTEAVIRYKRAMEELLPVYGESRSNMK
ncbi:MAG TPA: hypothetical protein VHS97_15665 [Isosphaeraceae bacterium]|nr:hypothetical protein [Isosphaeraceae bacterium]